MVMEQGRVQTDADWNEQLAEDSRRVRAGTLDALGHVFFPPTTPYAFLIAASTSGTTNSVDIGLGRMYLDGLLVENHGPYKTAVWDPALDELSNTPQPPPATLVALRLHQLHPLHQPAAPPRRNPAHRRRSLSRLPRCLAAPCHLHRGPRTHRPRHRHRYHRPPADRLAGQPHADDRVLHRRRVATPAPGPALSPARP